MTSNEIKKHFIDYFKKHTRFPHTQVDSSSLVPANDPTVLFTTAGMQQFKPYFLGKEQQAKKDFGTNRLTSIQKCFRVSDIDEVGDDTHLTFFEMLGNFSIGDYFKEDAIALAWDFLLHQLHFHKERLWVTYFCGDKTHKIPEDVETKNFWAKLGVDESRIIGLSSESNFWGPPGKTGPCGPSTEIHYDRDPKNKLSWHNSDPRRFLEIWNVVFMQYEKKEDGTLLELKQKNIDTGMGLERVASILEDKESVFDISSFKPILHAIREVGTFSKDAHDIRSVRIIADHLRACTFLIADTVQFGKKGQQAILRRIFRKALDQFIHPQPELLSVISAIVNEYGAWYPELNKKLNHIVAVMKEEWGAYLSLREKRVETYLEKIRKKQSNDPISQLEGPSERFLSSEEAFLLLTTHGFSQDQLIREGYSFDSDAVNKRMTTHREISKAGAEKKFGGHGLTNITSDEVPESEKKQITKLHTATHLLHAALRRVLGGTVRQEGSDITPERLRFDFQFDRKLTEEEKQKIQLIVNDWISRDCLVIHEVMPLQEALSKGALAFFREKYPNEVSVYSVVDPVSKEIISMELCGGPHVDHAAALGLFSIVSEKSVAKGMRRIKAIVGPKT